VNGRRRLSVFLGVADSPAGDDAKRRVQKKKRKQMKKNQRATLCWKKNVKRKGRLRFLRGEEKKKKVNQQQFTG